MKQAMKAWAYALPLVISMLYFFSNPYFLMSFLPDDLFYYLEAARRSALFGGWPSMDGINITSGFHSIYMLVCIGLYRIIGNFDHVINVTLVINLFIGYSLSLILYKLFFTKIRQTLSQIEQGILISFVLLNPIIFLISSRALENTMAAMGMFVTVLIHFKYLNRNKGLVSHEAVVLGILIGCCGLLRTDSLLIACALGIIWLFHLYRYDWSIKKILIFTLMPFSAGW